VNKTLNVVPTKVSDLHFDYENPRLAEYGITKATPEDEILKILWEAMGCPGTGPVHFRERILPS